MWYSRKLLANAATSGGVAETERLIIDGYFDLDSLEDDICGEAKRRAALSIASLRSAEGSEARRERLGSSSSGQTSLQPEARRERLASGASGQIAFQL